MRLILAAIASLLVAVTILFVDLSPVEHSEPVVESVESEVKRSVSAPVVAEAQSVTSGHTEQAVLEQVEGRLETDAAEVPKTVAEATAQAEEVAAEVVKEVTETVETVLGEVEVIAFDDKSRCEKFIDKIGSKLSFPLASREKAGTQLVYFTYPDETVKIARMDEFTRITGLKVVE